MNDSTPQDPAAEACPCVQTGSDDIDRVCTCSECEPAGDAFVDPCEINPRRRIVRATRPPPRVVSLENATTSTTTANGGNTAGAATPLTAYMAAHALGRDGNDRNNVSRISNALRQINNDEETDSDMPSLASDGASPSGSRSNTAGSNTGAATTSSIIGA